MAGHVVTGRQVRLNEGLLSEEKQYDRRELVGAVAGGPQRRASLGREAISAHRADTPWSGAGLNEGLLSEEKQSGWRMAMARFVAVPQRRASLGREAIQIVIPDQRKQQFASTKGFSRKRSNPGHPKMGSRGPV